MIFIILFNACAHLRTKAALDLIKQVSKEMPECYYSHPRLSSALLDALTKCNDISSAENLFLRMTKSSGDYGVLMSALNEENHFDKTLRLFHEMKQNGVDADIFNSLQIIKALSRIGDNSLAQIVIKQIPLTVLANTQIQTALLNMWVREIYTSFSSVYFLIY